jgi:hypothetical protein
MNRDLPGNNSMNPAGNDSRYSESNGDLDPTSFRRIGAGNRPIKYPSEQSSSLIFLSLRSIVTVYDLRRLKSYVI